MVQKQPRLDLCANIDEDTIELHAMGKLSDGTSLRHIASCETCQSLVAENRMYIDSIRRGLRCMQ